jgi:hypothetical protein|tara:strand:+ start:713 stop:1093 length:381 start_codon:yes stop_codon:yes gene_type:complete
MGFIFRKILNKIISSFKGNASTIFSFLFSAFKGMPIRVGLAILGSLLLTISFLGGLIWGFFSANLYNEDFRYALQNSITPLIILVFFWISLTTFLPSLERNLGILVKPSSETETEMETETETETQD